MHKLFQILLFAYKIVECHIYFQFFLTLQTAVSETKDIETRGRLFQQLLSLVDCILDGYSSQLASLAQNPDMTDRYVKVEEEFIQQKHTLITPFCKFHSKQDSHSISGWKCYSR